MIKKIFYGISVFLCFSASAMAQETYENMVLAGQDLTGTARYIGMGGAMDALGADMSTIKTNPAGVALFRRSSMCFTAGAILQEGASSFKGINPSSVTFDHMGMVYVRQVAPRSYFNFGMSYYISKNFRQILDIVDKFLPENVNGKQVYNSSQNKLTYLKLYNGVFNNNKDITYSAIDDQYMNIVSMEVPDNGNTYIYYPATDYRFKSAASGKINNFDFNLSANQSDRFYWGITFGLKWLTYKRYSEYTEQMAPNLDKLKYVGMDVDKQITGRGFDLAAGFIFRPIESSPFRIGFTLTTPTWYDLNIQNKSYMSVLVDKGTGKDEVLGDDPKNCSYDFKFYTPWKFGVSLGHTIGNNLALGASYEFVDYASSDMREISGYDTDGWNEYEVTESDRAMNRHIRRTVQGVSTVKLGAEYKPIPTLALRLGYNYVSPMYKNNAKKDVTIPSPGTAYAMTADYTNWSSTNKVTVGIGYDWHKYYLDLAYQYNTTSGSFYPFSDLDANVKAHWNNEYVSIKSQLDQLNKDKVKNQNQIKELNQKMANCIHPDENNNHSNPVAIKDQRHQLSVTFGYRF